MRWAHVQDFVWHDPGVAMRIVATTIEEVCIGCNPSGPGHLALWWAQKKHPGRGSAGSWPAFVSMQPASWPARVWTGHCPAHTLHYTGV